MHQWGIVEFSLSVTCPGDRHKQMELQIMKIEPFTELGFECCVSHSSTWVYSGETDLCHTDT